MYQPKRRFIPAIMAGVLGFGVAVAAAAQPATQPSQQDLQSQVQQLQSQVAQLRADQLQRQADEVAATEQVLRDADQHSQMLDSTSGMTGGWDSANYRFFLASEDGNFLFHPGIISQFRYIGSWKSTHENWEDGFEVRRLKVYADGNIVNKDLTYKVQLQNTDQGGAMSLEYAWGQLVFAHDVLGGDWGVRAGQYKNPVYHEEEATGDNVLLMVDRSMVDNLVGGNALGGPYVQGVNLMYTGNANPLHTQLLFVDGDNSGNTDFINVTSTGAQDKFGAAFRADYKFFGDWADNSDATGKNSGKKDFLAIGGGVDFSQSDTPVTEANFGTNTLRWDVGGTYLMTQANGENARSTKLIVYAAFVGDYRAFRGDFSGPSNECDIGQLVQVGYFLCPSWELTARYSGAEMDPRFKTMTQSTFHEIGVGIIRYLGDNGSAGNHAKIVFDANYLPNGSPAITGLGYQAQDSDRAEVVFRLMFQVWI
ncbi:MAG: hypothetical protein ABR964_16200 [Tepidisphaeraceae bacterium]|jgi:hypothetical protein